MINFNKNNLDELLNSINESARVEIERIINLLLETELTQFLQYEKYEFKGYNSGNNRNGYYQRTIDTKFGQITVKIPRDRNGEFNQQTIPSYSRRTDDLETTVLHLYKNGVSTREISDLIEKMYGHHYAPSTVSNITNVVLDDVETFHQRNIEQKFLAVFLDATFIPVKRGNNYTKEAVLIAIGINSQGYKQVLDYVINPSESIEIYRELLQSLKERGLNDVDLFVTDGLKGMRDMCLELFPRSKHQVCWTHLVRNAYKKVRKADRSKICEELKTIYASNSKDLAKIKLQDFYDRYQKIYPQVIKLLNTYKLSLFSFFNFPEVCRSLYTTNIIENFNKFVKRDITKKQSFSTIEALDKFIFLKVEDYNRRFTRKKHRNFTNLL